MRIRRGPSVKQIWLLLCVALLLTNSFAQVGRPRHATDLEQRYESLQCAMVTITWSETVTFTFTAPQHRPGSRPSKCQGRR